jgi:tRNA threonylcarbamoyladenosine biosynthesis protein TsaB
MTAILAIETATEACSVALYRDGEVSQCHEVIPRQHSQRLFAMLGELLPDGDLRRQGVDAIAYGCGPGSFTGLRIAASAVQGLAFAHSLPAVPVSTLACQAQTALRRESLPVNTLVLSLLDARINELYYATYGYVDGLAALRTGPGGCAPADLIVGDDGQPLYAVGSGCRFLEGLPTQLQQRIHGRAGDLLPEARDLIPLALAGLERGEIQRPEDVQPVYVRDEISWKKLSEQGKRGD